MYKIENLQIGDTVAIQMSNYYIPEWSANLTVSRVTKTQVIVPVGVLLYRFNRRTGYEIGSRGHLASPLLFLQTPEVVQHVEDAAYLKESMPKVRTMRDRVMERIWSMVSTSNISVENMRENLEKLGAILKILGKELTSSPR